MNDQLKELKKDLKDFEAQIRDQETAEKPDQEAIDLLKEAAANVKEQIAEIESQSKKSEDNKPDGWATQQSFEDAWAADLETFKKQIQEEEAAEKPDQEAIDLLKEAIANVEKIRAESRADFAKKQGQPKTRTRKASEKPAEQNKPKTPRRTTKAKTSEAQEKSKNETTAEPNQPKTEPKAPKEDKPKEVLDLSDKTAIAAYFDTHKGGKAPASLSWQRSTTLAQLDKLGYIYGVEAVEGTCLQIAVELDRDITCEVKGDAKVTAKKGELVIMIHFEGDKFRQFNIIGNMNNCALKVLDNKLFNSEKAETSLAKKTKDKNSNKPKKGSAEKDLADAIKKANAKGDRKSDEESYWGGKYKFLSTSKMALLLVHNYHQGLISEQIAAIFRDSNNRIVFEMAEAKNGQLSDKRNWLMLNEHTSQLTETNQPQKPYGLVDVRKSELEKHGKAMADYEPVAENRYLDALYAKRTIAAQDCKKLEKAARKCQNGNCAEGSPEAKELKHLESECERHLDPYSKLMPKVQKAFEEFYTKGYKLYASLTRKNGGKKMATADLVNAMADPNANPLTV